MMTLSVHTAQLLYAPVHSMWLPAVVFVKEWLHHLSAVLKLWLFPFKCDNRRCVSMQLRGGYLTQIQRAADRSVSSLVAWTPLTEHNDWVLVCTLLHHSKSSARFSQHEIQFQSSLWVPPPPPALCWGDVVWASRRWRMNRKQRIVVVIQAINESFCFSPFHFPHSLHTVCLSGWLKQQMIAMLSTHKERLIALWSNHQMQPCRSNLIQDSVIVFQYFFQVQVSILFLAWEQTKHNPDIEGSESDCVCDSLSLS